MKLAGKKVLMLLLCPSDLQDTVPAIPGRTRIMKMVFLFEKEVWPELKKDRSTDEYVLPVFFAWKYGPFSSEVLNDLEFLINRDYIDVQRGSSATNEELEEYEYWLDDLAEVASTEYVEEVFSLSKKGLEKARIIWAELTDNQREVVVEFRRIMISAPLGKILEYVYKKYQKEGYTDRSLIADRYLKS
jgi:uncharacterized protein YwgA